MQRLQQERYVLGSTGYITLVTSEEIRLDMIFAKLWYMVAAFEQRFSRFLPESELTSFNHTAGEWVTVSKAFHDLLVAARAMAERTDGLYNPFVLSALQRAGYEGSWPRPEVANPQTSYKDRSVVSIDGLEVRSREARIPAQSALDFGGIGKGYLLDQLAEFLDTESLVGYWLSLGGDIICSGTDVDNVPWRIGVQHDEQAVATIENGGRKLAIATSGITKRKGRNESGESWHHLIDPRTGKPATTDILTATVTAAHATEADIAAKCMVIVGAGQAAIAARHYPVDRVILQVKNRKEPLEIATTRQSETT